MSRLSYRCIAGSLTIALTPPFPQNLAEDIVALLSAEEWERVHTVNLDLGGCERLSSFEMGLIALVLQDPRLQGRRFRLRRVPGQVKTQLAMVGFDRQAIIEANGLPRLTAEEAAVAPEEIWQVAREACEAAADLRHEIKTLRDQVAHLEKVSELGQLAAGVAHEFNNILGIMRGYADLASTQVDNAAFVQEALKVIVESCERAKKITEALLNLARRKPMRKSLVDINEILQQQLDLMASRCLAAKIKIVTDLAPEAKTVADAFQIEQVFLNLLNNAAQAMPDGGTMWVRTRLAEAFVEVEVEDTGVGIPPENLQRIFTPFFTTKGPLGGGKGVGSGLGLSVSRAIVVSHGGAISVRSEVGKGSVFTVSLSRSQQAPAMPLAQAEALLPPANKIPSLRILVVDDEPRIRELLRNFLEKSGHAVRTAASGEEALAACLAEKPDLVFLDIIMPGMNGGDVLLGLRQMHKDIPVAVITGQAGKPLEAMLEIMHRAGNVELIRKPFQMDEIANFVAAIATQRG